MTYVVLKKLRISGKDYYTGDIIDEGADKSVFGLKALENRGLIVKAEKLRSLFKIKEAETGVSIDIDGQKISVSVGGVESAIRIMQQKSAEAKKLISDCDSEEILQIVRSVDSRADIKKTALSKLNSFGGE